MKLAFYSIAGMKSEYYEGMVEATVAIGNDHTLTLICEEEVKDKVAEMFAPKTKPLTDEEIEYYEHLIAKLFNCSVTQKVVGLDRVIRAIEGRHGIK